MNNIVPTEKLLKTCGKKEKIINGKEMKNEDNENLFKEIEVLNKINQKLKIDIDVYKYLI